MGGVMKCFLKKLLGYEFFFEKFVKPCGPPSYILNVRSLMNYSLFMISKRYLRNFCTLLSPFTFVPFYCNPPPPSPSFGISLAKEKYLRHDRFLNFKATLKLYFNLLQNNALTILESLYGKHERIWKQIKPKNGTIKFV